MDRYKPPPSLSENPPKKPNTTWRFCQADRVEAPRYEGGYEILVGCLLEILELKGRVLSGSHPHLQAHFSPG